MSDELSITKQILEELEILEQAWGKSIVDVDDLARLQSDNAVMKEALVKFSEKSNYDVDTDGEISWWPQEDREVTPWEFAQSIIAKVTHERD